MDTSAADKPRATVFLVDSDSVLSAALSTRLSDEGYSVVAALSIADAVQVFLDQPRIDLIITESLLPGASGIDLVNCVVGAHPRVHVIFISSIPESVLRRQGIDDQAVVFEKPVAVADVVSSVNRLLRKR